MFMVKRNMILKGETIWNNLLAVGITLSIIESEHVHGKEKQPRLCVLRVSTSVLCIITQ